MKYIYLIFIFSFPLFVFGQTDKNLKLAEKASIEDYDRTVYVVEHNYAGFNAKVTESNHSRYIYLRDSLRQNVLNGGNAFGATLIYVRMFNDAHLNIMPWNSKVTDFSGYTRGYTPRFIARHVNDSTFLIRAKSFETVYIDTIKQYVNLYKQSGCPNLIIDLRGNGGGIDRAYKPLLRLIYDRKGLGDGVAYYSTPDNIAMLEQYGEKAVDISLRKWLKQLCEKLESHPREFVGDSTYVIEYDSIHTYPRKVGIITDTLVGSSAEQFVIEAKIVCSRLTVYGRNTAGGLDYSNPGRTLLPCGLTLRYPMSCSFRVIKGRGIDDTGIIPDVPVSLPIPSELTDNLDEWTLWVAKELQ
ncbi:MAG: S41 family peptidase [Bacteroides sp.]|nr:S41 family peptidase [Bacteroides sp.]